ncbi:MULTISPECIES: glycerate kinase family protein [Staphylococcus]|uniref:glycerate kinase family protein n=1 Tax=Staphylococcus TaxID=1279 RepID=UPI000267DCF1|nr:glycerate kinase [Staphylococcus equorum]ANR69288.1 glycerate kinase [Staphylococcus equorum]KKI53988.1 Glycerate kinase [Staphylococcus equorum subsp. equorum]MCE5048556.1 glycerate kinase [Staphylococcus equorum]MCM3072753.1 glycerate kinase [Staphylococcus equorum]MDK9846552.1 glycerate kinase [Staphylococcus equorum]
MKFTVIPSGFKESLSAEEVGYAIEKGIKRVNSNYEVNVIPMVDGGEGFVESIIKIRNGYKIMTHVTGPVGQRIQSYFGVFKEGKETVAVIEMAAIAGLRHVPKTQRNPLYTTTYGVGQMIIKSLDYGVDRIIIGCGDSGTSDGGVGMAQAIGVKFYNKHGEAVYIDGGVDIDKIHDLDLSNIDNRVSTTPIDVAVNWSNILCGDKGVARVFGPQKGASQEDVEHLSNNLYHLAALIKQHTNKDLRYAEGTGASGGLGAGLIAFANATLHPRFDLIKNYIQIESNLESTDIVITAEGCIDYQTPNGKVPAEVARIAKNHNKPVIAFAGTIGKGAKINYQSGIDAFSSIIPEPATLENAINDADKWLEGSVESAIRYIMIGMNLFKAREQQKHKLKEVVTDAS